MNHPRFDERQRFRQPWLWLVLGLAAALSWWAFVQQIGLGEPFGSNPGPDWVVWLVWIGAGVLVPALFVFASLRLTVTDEAIVVRFRPLATERIALADVRAQRARTYNPILEYGGWGVRRSCLRNKRAYSVSGRRGVEVETVDGRMVMLGSMRAEELEQAIADAREALRQCR